MPNCEFVKKKTIFFCYFKQFSYHFSILIMSHDRHCIIHKKENFIRITKLKSILVEALILESEKFELISFRKNVS